jgi:alpha-glucosidase
MSTQEAPPESTLNFFRMLIALRKGEPTLVQGTMTLLERSKEILQYRRNHEDRTLLCYFNLSAQTQSIDLLTYADTGVQIVVQQGVVLQESTHKIEMKPWGWVWCLVSS